MLVTLHIVVDLDKILTYETAKMPLAPLSTSEACLDYQALAT